MNEQIFSQGIFEDCCSTTADGTIIAHLFCSELEHEPHLEMDRKIVGIANLLNFDKNSINFAKYIDCVREFLRC